MRHTPGASAAANLQSVIELLPFTQHDGTRPHPSLRQRRGLAMLRRIFVALMLSLAVVFALHSIARDVQTRSVAVAAHDIPRGRLLTMRDIGFRKIPGTTAIEGTFESGKDIVGRIAQIDMRKGTPMLSGTATTMPVVPDGATVLDVHMSGATDNIKQGDEITLIAATACAQPSCESASTVLVKRALVMGHPRNDKITTVTTLPCAIDHKLVPQLLAAQDGSAIMAVARPHDTG